ncbi:MAG: elongation factor Ts [Candidatus Paceibacterota bacterium]
MAITTEDIKALRERTGVSVIQCKKALEEAGGDQEKALVILRKHSANAAAKKANRELASGVVQAYIHVSKDIGAMVTLSCETDFVAKNEEFISLAYDIALHVAATDPEFLSRSEVTEDSMKSAKEVFASEVADKPKEMQEKILEGKLDAYFKDKVLLEQEFVKDPSVTIEKLVAGATQKFGEKVELTKYIRFSTRA